jgi:hypothetical protein
MNTNNNRVRVIPSEKANTEPVMKVRTRYSKYLIEPCSVTVTKQDIEIAENLYLNELGRKPTFNEIIAVKLRINELNLASSSFSKGSAKNRTVVRCKRVTLQDGRIVRIPVL